MPSSRGRNRAGQPICPDANDKTMPGICNPDFSIDNADSLSIMAGGLWFSDEAQCNRLIPIGLTAVPPSAPDTDPGTPIDPPEDGDGIDASACAAPGSKVRRDDTDGCGDPVSPTTSAPPSSITPKPTISCTLQEEDPDEFINTPGCVCSGKTYPVLSVTDTNAGQDASCAYTALPTSTNAPVSNPVSTNTAACQVCTLVTNEESNCTPLPGCTPSSSSAIPASTAGSPTAAPSAKTTVQVSNNPVHVGNLQGAALYSAALKAMQSKCPDPPSAGVKTSCSSDGSPVDNVEYVQSATDGDTTSGGEIEEATVTFTIEDSSYTSAGQKLAMLGAAAQAINGSATGKACRDLEYDIECPTQPLDVSPGGPGCHKQMTVCDAANLVTVEVYDGTGIIASMNVEVSFQIDGLTSAFECELIIDTIELALGVVAPELDAADWELLGEIQAMCAEASGAKRRLMLG